MKCLCSCLLICLTLGSCGLRGPQYDLVCINLGKHSLNNVLVKYVANDSFSFGVLSPHAVATRNRVDEQAPIPETAQVRWVTEADGKAHQKQLNIKSVISTGLVRGCLIFWIAQDNAGVTWRTQEQWGNTIYKRRIFFAKE